ncbi:MAG: hypothetical protein NTW66_02610 [Candidatus Magasanikbacteria bacterium]|nr:hypothetical protein [Candidatus Magasanikbacteria bacterium]
MNQNPSEKNLIPGAEPDGLTKRSETPDFGVEEEAVKEEVETQAAPEEIKPAEIKEGGILPKPKQSRRAATMPPMPRDELTKQVEKVLSEGLKDAFEKLPPIAQQEFKLKGEQTAVKIRELLRSAKIKVKKIFRLIIEWLMLLPSINHFFLEQEAKIKTDKIIELKKRDEDKVHL